jgi:hypothetical protein
MLKAGRISLNIFFRGLTRKEPGEGGYFLGVVGWMRFGGRHKAGVFFQPSGLHACPRCSKFTISPAISIANSSEIPFK